MRWKVEHITENSNNILIDNLQISDELKEPVGMGFPVKLAERLAEIHNSDIDRLSSEIREWEKSHDAFSKLDAELRIRADRLADACDKVLESVIRTDEDNALNDLFEILISYRESRT